MSGFSSHEEVIVACGNAALARKIFEVSGVEVSEKRVGGWRLRNSIPGPYFTAVAAAAAALGHASVTVERLAHMAARDVDTSLSPSAPQPPTIGGADPAAEASRLASPASAATPLLRREVSSLVMD